MLHNLTTKKDITTFSISPENITGEKGKGGMSVDGSAQNAARDLGQGWKVNPYLVVPTKSTAVLADVRGQGAIKHIWIVDSSTDGRLTLLKIYFDGQESPSVCAPLYDFFCNADNREYHQINSLAICYNPRRGMNCYFEMPYKTGFRIELENIGDENEVMVYYQIDCESKEISDDSLYFHAQFRRINPLPYKDVYTILDNVKGNGVYVGTYLYWNVKSNGWWGEGEFKFYIDGDTDFPTICGTGTEDYFGGAYNFDVDGEYKDFSGPYTGFSKNQTDNTYKSQRAFNMYRFHIQDPIYFKKDIKVTVQALGWRSNGRYLPLCDDISSVAYWYSDNLNDEFKPTPSKDELEIM